MLRRSTVGRIRGDTIIEVVVSFAIFSSVAVVALALMNQGLVSAQKALEITQVRQQIDAQAETLRFMHHNYVLNQNADGEAATKWKAITAKKQTEATKFSETSGEQKCPEVPETAFILNSKNVSLHSGDRPKSMTNLESPPPYSRIAYAENDTTLISADGIWIEAVEDGLSSATPGQVHFTDFHIRACWYSPGSSPVVTIGTIVRLYEP
jgi:type II secretory pathway pseudopilin PulG